jgi:hypothetical protein
MQFHANSSWYIYLPLGFKRLITSCDIHTVTLRYVVSFTEQGPIRLKETQIRSVSYRMLSGRLKRNSEDYGSFLADRRSCSHVLQTSRTRVIVYMTFLTADRTAPNTNQVAILTRHRRMQVILSEVSTTVSIKATVLCDVTPCSLVSTRWVLDAVNC